MRAPQETSWYPLALPTLSFVLGTLAQSTFLFFLVPAYAQAHGLGSLQLVAFAACALATMALGVPAGRLADRVPRRRVMRLGWSMATLSALLLAFAPPGLPALVLAALGMGGGLAFGHTAFQSYVADVIRGHAVANGYGITSSLAILGSAAGPITAGLMLAAMGRDAGLVAVALLLAGCAAGAVASSFLLPTMRSALSARSVPPRVGFVAATVQAFDPRPPPRSARRRREESHSLAVYATAFAFLGLGYGLTMPWFAPWLFQAHGLSASAWGLVLGWSTILSAGGVYLTGRLAARGDGALRLMGVLAAGSALAMVGVGFAPGAAAAVGFFLARQLLGNGVGPALSAGLVLEVSEESRGRSFGLVNVAWNLPWAMGAAAGGWLLPLLGGWLFVAGAALVVLAPLVAALLRRRAPPGPARGPAREAAARA